jgi:hypothetical protein
MTATAYRYHLPKKTLKGDCPQCGPRHRRTLSRYVDSQTGEPLPEEFGRCDRESNCGYHLSPYHKDPSGTSYADRMFEQWKQDNPLPNHGQKPYARTYPANPKPPQTVSSSPSPPKPIYSLPDEVFRKSLGHYERNQFATLLRGHFGPHKADELLLRFQIGTSAYWPGATVFWLIDEQSRARSGQVVLFAEDWHRAKYEDREGKQRVCISSVSHGLKRHHRSSGNNVPDWLTDYHDNAPRWPVPFGLHQLRGTSEQQPVAIVEAPKTAVLCSAYFPDFVWLAIGAKSYPNAERLAALRGRRIHLFPDLNAYADWVKKAEALRAEGFQISTSSLLEDQATEQQRAEGLDLADYLLQPQQPRIITTLAEWEPGTILRPDPANLSICKQTSPTRGREAKNNQLSISTLGIDENGLKTDTLVWIFKFFLFRRVRLTV